MLSARGVLFLGVLCLSAAAKPTIMFRLDDLQCWWMEENSMSIIKAFLRHSVPITVGIITQETMDCDLFAELKPLYDANPSLIEIASHSVTHRAMSRLTYEEQLAELKNSKLAIEAVFGVGTVRQFIPPQNLWNFETILGMQQTGYDILSGQCPISQSSGSRQDDMCAATMYLNRPLFFPRIDEVTHVPIGASISNMADESILLTLEQLFNGNAALCEEELCSVSTQVTANVPLTQPDAGEWANVMMHPQCFADRDDAAIQAYFDQVLTYAVAYYEPRLAVAFVGPRGSRPNEPGQINPRLTNSTATRH